MSTRPLTTTSYAILGLIAIRPRSTYELAQMMRRSLHFIWPRAESNLYAEPKRLVDGGMATAEVSWNGERKRTVYSITPRGAEALRDWLADDPAPQRVESEAATRAIAADADEWITEVSEVADVYARGDGPFPERIHVNALLATLMIEQARTASRWATWAATEVEGWTDPATADVEWSVGTLRRVLDGEPFSGAP